MIHTVDGRWWAADHGIAYIQGLGVTIFFLISGYIVTRTTLPKALAGKYDVIDFAIDRGTRIVTPLVPAIILIYICDLFFFTDGQAQRFFDVHLNLPTLVANAALLFNNPLLAAISKVGHMPWLDVGRIGSAQPLWTVVIEWWIYIAFGVLAIEWILRRRFTLVSLLWFGFALLYPWATIVKGMALPFAWLFGAFYCLAEDKIRAIPKLPLGVIVVISAIMAGTVWKISGYDFYDPLFVCLFSVAFLFSHRLLDDAVSDGRRTMPAIFNLWSDYSYSIYLLHFSLLIYLEALHPSFLTPIKCVITGYLISNICAFIYWRLIEKRHAAVRRYFHHLRGNRARFTKAS